MDGKIVIQFSHIKHDPIRIIGSKLIQWFGRGWASHVDAVIQQNGETILIGTLPFKGVHKRSLIKDVYIKKQTIILSCTLEQEEKFNTFINAQVGKPYDWRSIISFVIPWRNWREDDSWFCSEIIAAGLEASGYLKYPLSISNSKITPQDLLMICSILVDVSEK